MTRIVTINITHVYECNTDNMSCTSSLYTTCWTILKGQHYSQDVSGYMMHAFINLCQAGHVLKFEIRTHTLSVATAP